MIIDLTEKKFETPEDFDKLVENYPSKSFGFVTQEQKYKIVNFPGQYTRYIMKIGFKNDLLVYDGILGSTIIVTARDMDSRITAEDIYDYAMKVADLNKFAQLVKDNPPDKE